jgi:hypothetical protein
MYLCCAIIILSIVYNLGAMRILRVRKESIIQYRYNNITLIGSSHTHTHTPLWKLVVTSKIEIECSPAILSAQRYNSLGPLNCIRSEIGPHAKVSAGSGPRGRKCASHAQNSYTLHYKVTHRKYTPEKGISSPE